MSKKIVNKLRELNPSETAIITGKKDTIIQTCWREQKNGKRFSKKVLKESDVTIEVKREK